MDANLNIEIGDNTSNDPELSDKIIEIINDDTLKKLRDEKRKLRCKNTNKKRYDNDNEYKEHKKQQSKQNYILLKCAKQHFQLSKTP